MHNSTSILDLTVTTGDSVFSPDQISETTFREVVEAIKNDPETAEIINQIRALNDKDQQNALKSKLKYFNPGRFKGRRAKEAFLSTQAFVFDIDEVEDFDNLREMLENWSYTSAVFTSPRGKGLKLIVMINTPLLIGKKFTAVYKKLSNIIEQKFSIHLDPATCDSARACFYSHDPEIYVNEQAEAFNLEELLVEEDAATKEKKSGKRQEILERMTGVPEGERHSALVQIIGLSLSKGFDKKFIYQTAYGINQLNQPPFPDDEFNREFESIYNSLTKDRAEEQIPFYSIIETKTGVKLKINMAQFIDFLAGKGFAKIRLSESNYAFVSIDDHVIKQVSIVEIKDFLDKFISGSNDTLKEEVREQIIKLNKSFLSEESLQFLPTITPKILRGTKDTAYLFFKNVYLQITKEEIYALSYDMLPAGKIWHESIIQREIDVERLANDKGVSEYQTMLLNVCRKEERWFEALACSIGYMAHDYKDKANAKAVILCDEEIPAADDSNGGTGKSLVCEGLKHVRKATIVDGKNYKTDSSFVFQRINHSTDVVVIDDARKQFDFESLLSVITSDITIEKKHQNPFTIPFEQSPKFIITTNYTIKGNGNSFDRRRHEIEFSNYYNKNFTPLDEFGHRLFDEWDDAEWTRFYRTMAFFIQRYLQKGLVKYEVRNLKVRRIIDATCQEFLDFMDDFVQSGVRYNKRDLFGKFKAHYPEYANKTQHIFTRWLKVYADSTGQTLDETKSGKDRFVTFMGDPSEDLFSINTQDKTDNEELELL